MTEEKTKIRVYIALLCLVAVLIVGLIVLRGGKRPEPQLPAVTPRPTAEVVIREREVEKIVEVEKEISAEIIQDGLREMGTLVTEEYYFTEVVSFSSIKKLFDIELGITESSYLASYEGVVTAGIDFAAITVVKDDDENTVTVTLPRAEILSVDIDPESFELYSEKNGLGNPLSAADFNASLVELEKNAAAKAVDRGLLQKADENARAVIRNFITGMLGPGEYAIVLTGMD